jgi:hypothetical protein
MEVPHGHSTAAKRLPFIDGSKSGIQPIKFHDDKSKAPASFLFSLGPGLFQPFHLSSTFSASEAHPFFRPYSLRYQRER